MRASVDEYARALLDSNASVQEVVVFGSFERGNYGPGSDVDIFVLLSHSAKPVRERVPDFLPLEFPVPMDVFPYTQDEVEELQPSPVLIAVAASGWRYRREKHAS